MSILTIITILVFIATLGLIIVGIYFLIEAPATRSRMRSRLAAIQQTATHGMAESDVQIVREEVLTKIPLLDRLLLQVPLLNSFQLYLQQAAVEMSSWTILAIAMALAVFGFLAGLLASFPAFLAITFGLLAGAVPFIIVTFKRRRRFNKFEEQFPDAMDMLARAVRAGYAASSAFELVADEMAQPLSGEFRVLFEQQNLGLPMREALDNMAVWLPLADVKIFVTSMQIQAQAGGNLAEILDNLSYVVRERFKILRQIRVYTAEGRLSLFVLTGLPPVAALLFFLSNPDYMMTLFTDPMGHALLAAGIVMQLIGFLIIRKIIDIKV
jgi:tight adherence protein B